MSYPQVTLRILLLLLTALACASCVDVTNIDAVGDDFYYGCADQQDCVVAGDTTPYVCCFDKLLESDNQCRGRCVQRCAEGLDDGAAVCSELGISPQ